MCLLGNENEGNINFAAKENLWILGPDPLSSPEILITLSGILVILKVVPCFTNVGRVDGCRSIFKCGIQLL